jgi:A/G-specific adenine glycosylase
MLQQTTVAAVIPYYDRFVSRFPTVAALAAASLDEVLAAWAGLGYYARARNLHACARAVVAAGGAFPRDRAGLLALPGIGAYTATAIAAIAYNQPGVPVDGNVERVCARLFAIATPLPAAKPALSAAAARLGADPDAGAKPSDFAQALFDLGATVCTPEKPACAICPWRDTCEGRAAGIAASLPRRAAKPVRPRRHGAHFWLTDGTSCALRRRPPEGLLGGMEELPGTPWRAEPWAWAEAAAHAPAAADWRPAGQVRHVFTHFELRIELYAAHTARLPPGLVRAIAELDRAALPSVMRKCVAQAQAQASRA